MADPDATQDFELPWRRRSSTPPAERLHLVIVWSLEEPERVGQSARLSEGAWLGRGEPEADESARLDFKATRAPIAAPAWLQASRLARQQLCFRDVSADGALVESVGRCPMAVNGSPVVSARIKSGDAITLRNAMVLLVTKRGAGSDVRRHARADFPFGDVDAKHPRTIGRMPCLRAQLGAARAGRARATNLGLPATSSRGLL